MRAPRVPNKHQPWGGACIAFGRPLPVAALCAQVRVHDDPEFHCMVTARKGVSTLVLPICLIGVPTKLLKTGRGFGLGALSHSHRSRFLPLGVTGRRVFRGSFLLPENRGTRHIIRCALSRGARAHSRQASGSSPCRRNTLTHEQAVNPMAHVSHHQVPSLNGSFRPDQHGRSAQAWRYQFQVMRCPE